MEWDRAHNVDAWQSACRADVRNLARDSDTLLVLAAIVFALFALPWLWAFLLRRMAEVSKAFSGKRPPDAQ